MKKRLCIALLSLLLIFLGCLMGHFRVNLSHKIFNKTITVEEFLKIEDLNRWNELYINKDGNIEYKKRVIIKNDTLKPLCYGNTDSKEEMLILYESGWYKARGLDI